MNEKKQSRMRRARADPRAGSREQKAVRLTVHRSNCHIYAQVIDASGAKVIASASTLDKEVRGQMPQRRQREGRGAGGQAHRGKGRERRASRRWRSTVPATNTTGA